MTTNPSAFLAACRAGDVPVITATLDADPAVARVTDDAGRTGLHLAHGHPEAVRLLLARGADPNARDRGDNITPLHLAAANRIVESVRLLLDAGADVHGTGDLHEGDVIGWAAAQGNHDVIDLLVARGARHHVFSALALRDHDLLRRVVDENPAALARRRSRYENRHTAVHAAFAAPDGLGYLAGTPDIAALSLLIELGADVDATDDRGRTPLDVALLRGNVEAARLLSDAGARRGAGAALEPRADVAAAAGALADTVVAGEPMFRVVDGRTTVRWFQAIGFEVLDAYQEDGDLRYARLGFGRCRFAIAPGGGPPRGASLWVFTTDIDDLHQLVVQRQLQAVSDALADPSAMQWPFDEDLYTPFYGGRQFSIRDPNGLVVVFHQPDGVDGSDDADP
ncbi:MAG TPA: ankyrin repeat domain-containing protein [Luteitalea sp.]|nr:ankyrin repeat domain-containing protein [Luteitalea sp.]